MAYKQWINTSEIQKKSWVCGYCGDSVGGDSGYKRLDEPTSTFGTREGSAIAICPSCGRPTYFEREAHNEYEQYPLPKVGRSLSHLPKEIEGLYEDIRKSVSAGAFTSAVLASRKMLMHIAVAEGASEKSSFKQCVEYMRDENVVPRSAHAWVDYIRDKGNEANHEIVMSTEEDAHLLLQFIEQILLSVYEFPATLPTGKS